MSTIEEGPKTSFDVIKWILCFIALAGAVYANHALVDGSVLIRAGVIVVLVATGLWVGFATSKGRRSLAFAKEAKVEARKVVWPTRSETVRTTLIIIASVALVSLLLWGLDAVIVKLIGFLTIS